MYAVLLVVATVLSRAVPIEPPTCWEVLTVAEVTPESWGATPAVAVEKVGVHHDRPLVPGTGPSTATVSYTLHNTGNVTLVPKVELKAVGLFGRTLLSRDLTGLPSELLPGQRVRLTAVWRGAPQLDWGDLTVTASAKGTRESVRVSFLAVPWLVLLLLTAAAAGGTAVLVRTRRRRAARDGETKDTKDITGTTGTKEGKGGTEGEEALEGVGG